jgi:hypothetical protein
VRQEHRVSDLRVVVSTLAMWTNVQHTIPQERWWPSGDFSAARRLLPLQHLAHMSLQVHTSPWSRQTFLFLKSYGLSRYATYTYLLHTYMYEQSRNVILKACMSALSRQTSSLPPRGAHCLPLITHHSSLITHHWYVRTYALMCTEACMCRCWQHATVD